MKWKNEDGLGCINSMDNSNFIWVSGIACENFFIHQDLTFRDRFALTHRHTGFKMAHAPDRLPLMELASELLRQSPDINWGTTNKNDLLKQVGGEEGHIATLCREVSHA